MIILPNNFKTILADKKIAADKRIDKLIELIKNSGLSDLENISFSDLKEANHTKLKTLLELFQKEPLALKKDQTLTSLKEKIENIIKESNPDSKKRVIRLIKDAASNLMEIDKEIEKNIKLNSNITEEKAPDNLIRNLQKKSKEIEKLIDSLKTDIKRDDSKSDTLESKTLSIKDLPKDDIKNLNRLVIKLQEKISEFSNKAPLLEKTLKSLKEATDRLMIQGEKDPKESFKAVEKDINSILLDAVKSKKSSKIKLINSSGINSHLKNLTTKIKEIETLISNKPEFKEFKQTLKNFTSTIKEINFESNIKNSGIFFESNLKETTTNKDNSFQKIENDLKKNLFHIEKIAIDNKDTKVAELTSKALSHIETLQLNSIINSNINIFIPFDWSDLENGLISFKSTKGKNFSCKIDLELKSLGKIDIFMLLNSNDISIGIDVKNLEFKNLLKEKKVELEKMLKSIKLNPHIFFHSQEKNSYIESDELDLGMDIRV